METRFEHDMAAVLAADREEEAAARQAEIQAEADRKKAEAARQAELDRNGGYSDAFAEWGKEFLAAAAEKRARDNRTASVFPFLVRPETPDTPGE